MKKCDIKTKRMSNPETLELAKIVVDTSYYGWLINYAQISSMIASKVCILREIYLIGRDIIKIRINL